MRERGTRLPRDSSRTRSAARSTAGLCVTAIRVTGMRMIVLTTRRSVFASRPLVNSSRSSKAGRRYNARASRIRCVCPVDRADPISPMGVL